ncbi:hypothetical protein G7084_05565 [Weissella coleopterorum]|uniref:RibT protein n=1 Tax=Weissella coleopterorum TaxID=2714949 RepID=A0A6G8B0J0_9LACO|nr:hypothetical protein [Weissella coleopterorum]QIL50828.1 hypothetical protein G7084_05565 [Weissella coleopterorum]
MLVMVSETQPKIAMGLMSHVDNLPTFVEIQREVNWYHADSNRHLMLWKDPKTRHFTAVIGVEEMDEILILQLVAFGPEVANYEQKLVGREIYAALSNWFPKTTLMGTIRTQKILNEWKKQQLTDIEMSD